MRGSGHGPKMGKFSGAHSEESPKKVVSKWGSMGISPVMAIFSKLDRGSMLFFRGYDMVVLASRRSANMSKNFVFEPFAKSEKGGFKVGL